MRDLHVLEQRNQTLEREANGWRQTEQRIRQLIRLAEDLLASGTLHEKARQITDQVVEMLDADFARIWMVRPGDRCATGCPHALVDEGPHVCRHRDRCLHLVASSGRYTHLDGEMHGRVPFGSYKIGKVAAAETPGFLTNDVVSDPRVHDRGWAERLGLVSFAGYRLLSLTAEPVGVLALFGTRAISADEDILLQSVASIASQAIQTAAVEEGLVRAKGEWERTFHSMPDLIALLDEHHRIIRVNQAMADRLGCTPEECVGQTCHACVHGMDEPPPYCPHAQVLEDGQGHEVEVHEDRLQGDFHVMTSPLTDGDGQVVGSVHIARDITERIRCEQRQRAISRVREAVWAMQHPDDIRQLLVALNESFDMLGIAYESSGINWIDGDPPVVRCCSLSGTGEWIGEPGDRGREALRQIWRRGEVAYRPDLDAEDIYREGPHIETAFGLPVRTVLDVPFANGTLALNSSIAHAYSADDLQVLQELAHVLEEGFQRMHDLQALERRNQELEREIAERKQAEQRLAMEQKRKEVLSHIRDQLWGMEDASDLDDLMTAVHEGLQSLGARYGHVGLNTITPEGDVLAHVMDAKGVWHRSKSPRGRQMILDIWSRGATAYRRDLQETDEYGELPRLRRTRSVVDVPFSRGTLAVSSEEPSAFSDEDLHVLEDMAGVLSETFARLEDIGRQKESEEGYRRLVEELPVGIAHTSATGEVLYHNPYAQRMFGYSVEELQQLRAQDLYVDLQDRQELIESLERKGEHTYEYRLRRKDGQMIWVRGTTLAIRNDGGEVTRFQGYLEDITEVRQAEEATNVGLALQRVRNEILLMEDEEGWGKVVQRLEEELHDLVDFRNCGVNLLDAKADVQIDYFMTPEGLQSEKVPGIPPVLQHVQETGEPLYRRSRAEIDRWARNRSRLDARSVVDVPFPGGTLAINSTEEDAFSEQDIRVLSQFAQVMAEGVRRLADLAQRQEMERILRLERDLAMKLSAPHDLNTAIGEILETALQIDGIDGGGVYLVDREAGGIDLLTHKGLPEAFVSRVRHLEADSPQARLIAAGEPIYTRSADIRSDTDEMRAVAGLRALAVIPVHYEQQVVAVLNLASRVHDEIPHTTRQALETIASHIGGPIARAEAEEKLRDSQQNLQTLFSSLDDFLFVLDMRGAILSCNPVACERLGYSAEQLASMNVLELHPPELREEAMKIVAGMVAGEVSVCPIPLQARDGRRIPVETMVTRGRWDGEDVLFGISRDTGEREELERERIRIERLRAVGELALGVSHNLNNILTGVLVPAELIRRRTDDPKLRRDADTVITSAHHARDVVQRLQRSVRTEREDLYPVPVDEIVQQAVETSRPRWKDEAEAQGASIDVVTDIGDVPHIRGTRSDLHSILLNLLFNAVDAMPEGGKISLRACEEESEVWLRVRDTGIGMEEELQQGIFEPFSTTKKTVDAGLGLSTVYRIVTDWGGSIEVESDLGRGTTFLLRLPVWEDAAVAQEAAPCARVLVVDDDEPTRSVLTRLLGDDFEVAHAQSGREAVEGFRPGYYGAVLIDLGMAGMTGDHVARAMKEMDPSLGTIRLNPGFPTQECEYVTGS